ncbi:hypothetical protein ABZ419_09030 [Streptomyces cinnamoneus]|uniref:hypothetical protein n=1 Tax=Streptomyces cinnamoneus TaxID=53446 RepID=UPI0033D621B1
MNFERPTARTSDGFGTFDLTVDLVVGPELTGWRWKDEDECAHARRLGIVSDSEHQAVEAARDQVLVDARRALRPVRRRRRVDGLAVEPGVSVCERARSAGWLLGPAPTRRA